MDEEGKKTEPVSLSEALYGNIPEFSERFCNFEYIDSGGYGDVFKAMDRKLKQFVAIKIISKKKLPREKDYERVMREVRVARELSHPNLIKYYEIYENKDYLAIAMEYIDGITLQEKIRKEGKLDEKEIKKFLFIMVEVVNYLHLKGVIHRDIKPSNLFIAKDGNIKLGDFGIVYIEGEDKLTKTDQTLGTPTYMSPEQIGGKKLTKETDWYSLGITIYEMATGDVPFKGTAGEIMKGHLKEKIPPLKGNKKLWKLIQGLTIKEPEKRWGLKEVKKYIEEKKLPFLPEEKKNFSIFALFIIFISIVFYLTPKIFTHAPTSAEFKGKKIKVYSKNKILIEKEMEREISDVKILNIDEDKEKEIIVAYYFKPEDFENKNMENMIKIADILNENLLMKYNFQIQNLIFYKKFQYFSLNYISRIYPLIEIRNDKVLKSNGFYINVQHQFYPSIIYFYHREDFKVPSEISNDGFIQGICLWDDKIVLVGCANPLLHQSFISVLEKRKYGTEFGDVLNIDLEGVISYYLLGEVNIGNQIFFSLDNSKLKIYIEYSNKTYYLERDGTLFGFKKETPETTKKLLENYSKVRIFINDLDFQRAKNLINESIDLSKDFNLYGFTSLFASLLSEIFYFEGNVDDAINICSEYAENYKDYGKDLYVKAGYYAYLKGKYKKAIDLWNKEFPVGSPRTLEVKTFSVYSSILNEDWKRAEGLLASDFSQGVQIWANYRNYQKGVMYLLRKNLNEAIKILRPCLDDLNMEDLATFYFISKVLKGEADVENFEKYIKNYPKGPLYLQFAGACTKGEWENAKFLYFQMEKAAVHDPGVALIYPVIRKITKIYPEIFNSF